MASRIPTTRRRLMIGGAAVIAVVLVAVVVVVVRSSRGGGMTVAQRLDALRLTVVGMETTTTGGSPVQIAQLRSFTASAGALDDELSKSPGQFTGETVFEYVSLLTRARVVLTQAPVATDAGDARTVSLLAIEQGVAAAAGYFAHHPSEIPAGARSGTTATPAPGGGGSR